MKSLTGVILGINTEKTEGVIRDDEGNRYPFDFDQIQSVEEVKQGQRVDFIVEDDRAKNIYFEKSSGIETSAKEILDSTQKMISQANFKPIKTTLTKKPVIFGIAGAAILVILFSLFSGSEPSEDDIKHAMNISLDNNSLIGAYVDRDSIKKNSCAKNTEGKSFICQVQITVTSFGRISRTVPVRMEKGNDGWEAEINF